MTLATDLIGLSASELVLRLMSLQPSIERVSFVAFTPSAGVEERLQLGASPLEATPSKQLLASRSFPILLTELLRHSRHPKRKVIHVATSDLSISSLEALVSHLSEGVALGFCSACRIRGKSHSAHIPLLDFRIPSGGESELDVLCEALRLMGLQRGAVLDSGKSYHFYGFDLLNQSQWREFMARSLLLAPLTDVRYIAHRLLERQSILRLSSTALKPTIPRVVRLLST